MYEPRTEQVGGVGTFCKPRGGGGGGGGGCCSLEPSLKLPWRQECGEEGGQGSCWEVWEPVST